MPVDNPIYDRLAETWRDEDAIPALLRVRINRARLGYMRRALTADVGVDLSSKRCLDVGCGGGFACGGVGARATDVCQKLGSTDDTSITKPLICKYDTRKSRSAMATS